MAKSKSGIEWTDVTWNPSRGCRKVSPGCANCYAETFAERFRGVPGHPYEQGFDLRLVAKKILEPLKYKAGTKVFVNSMSDLFFEDIPEEFVASVFGVMAVRQDVIFQVLTKRARRMRSFIDGRRALPTNFLETPGELVASAAEGLRGPDGGRVVIWDPPRHPWPGWPLPNVWIGVSVEDQKRYDSRLPDLLRTPAAVHFISAEPLLGPLELGLDGIVPKAWGLGYTPVGALLDWVIVGGESGPRRRPMALEWARSIRDDCLRAGVPFFFKQIDKKAPIPGDLMIRQFPQGGRP